MESCDFITKHRPYTLPDGREILSEQRYIHPKIDPCRASSLLMSSDSIAKMVGLAHRIHVSDPDANDTAIYVIAPDDYGVCKVGISNNPQARLMQLQVAHWAELKLLAAGWASFSSAVTIEKTVLRAAKDMGVRLCGEWLEVEPEEAAQMIFKAARYAKLDIADSAMCLANLANRVSGLYKQRRQQREFVLPIPA